MQEYHISVKIANPHAHPGREKPIKVWIPDTLTHLDDFEAWAVDSVLKYQSRSIYLSDDPETIPAPMAYNEWLRPIMGNDATQIMAGLEDDDVLECDHTARWGHTKTHNKGKQQGERLNAQDLYAARVSPDQNDPYPTDDRTPTGAKCWCYWLHPQHRDKEYVARVLTDTRLLANIKRAAKRNAASPPPKRSEGAEINNRWVQTLTVLPDYEYGSNAKNPHHERGATDRLADGQRFCVEDDQGRVHTSATSIGRDERPKIALNGHTDLWQCDVSSCQPFLAAVTLNVPQWRKDCEDGVFWARLEDNLECPLPPKKKLKNAFMPILFGQRGNTNTVVGRALDRLYPGVLDRLGEANMKVVVGKREDRGRFARQLQTIEAKIVIRGP